MAATDETQTTREANFSISEQFKGLHEVQECLEGQGEIDLHTHLANCEKNPGHTGFIPVKKFTIEHFPSGYHDNDLYDLTKAMADLTVRIAVNFTSANRPEFVPGSKDPYPCYNTRGENALHTGTGRVGQVIKHTEEIDADDFIPCQCSECNQSETPSKVWWRVEVTTAAHVVFYMSEAKQSKCRLWFDDDNSPVVNIYRVLGGGDSNVLELGILYCATHDADLIGILEKKLGHFNVLWRIVKDKYKSRKHLDKLTIIVSHPHGCSKQVSVGQWVHRQEVDVYDGARYTYTTCTCPGSSGATIWRLGWWSGNPHSETNSFGLNYSGVSQYHIF